MFRYLIILLLISRINLNKSKNLIKWGKKRRIFSAYLTQVNKKKNRRVECHVSEQRTYFYW